MGEGAVTLSDFFFFFSSFFLGIHSAIRFLRPPLSRILFGALAEFHGTRTGPIFICLVATLDDEFVYCRSEPKSCTGMQRESE